MKVESDEMEPEELVGLVVPTTALRSAPRGRSPRATQGEPRTDHFTWETSAMSRSESPLKAPAVASTTVSPAMGGPTTPAYSTPTRRPQFGGARPDMRLSAAPSLYNARDEAAETDSLSTCTSDDPSVEFTMEVTPIVDIPLLLPPEVASPTRVNFAQPAPLAVDVEFVDSQAVNH